MGTTTHGMDEWLHVLDTLEERAAREFPKVVSKGALNIKRDWRAGWDAIKHVRTHIPHIVSGIGYDTSREGWVFSAEIGVAASNRQAFLAHILEYGTLHSAPHPAGQMALDAEEPRFIQACADIAEKLLSHE